MEIGNFVYCYVSNIYKRMQPIIGAQVMLSQ